MLRSILRILHWMFNHVFEPYVQRDWVSALLFFFCFFTVVLVDFVFFGWLDRSFISEKKKKKTPSGRHSMRQLVHELHRVKKSSPNS